MSYQSMEEAKLRGEKENIPFWKAIQLEDAQERDVKIEDSWEKMKYMWQSMLDALDAYEPDKVSRSGLVGSRTWSDHCQPGISCGSIGRMSGRDRFRFGNGSRGNLLYQRRRYGSDRTCLCDGIEEPDGTCM